MLTKSLTNFYVALPSMVCDTWGKENDLCLRGKHILKASIDQIWWIFLVWQSLLVVVCYCRLRILCLWMLFGMVQVARISSSHHSRSNRHHTWPVKFPSRDSLQYQQDFQKKAGGYYSWTKVGDYYGAILFQFTMCKSFYRFRWMNYTNLARVVRYMVKFDALLSQDDDLKGLLHSLSEHNVSVHDIVQAIQQASPTCQDIFLDCQW